jgi:hypothetical protein
MRADAEAMTALVRRHGAVVVLRSASGSGPLSVEQTRTRGGARRAFAALMQRLTEGPGVGAADEYPEDATVVAARIERGRIAAEIHVPFASPPGEPASGVREPRRPSPPSGRAGTARERPGSSA